MSDKIEGLDNPETDEAEVKEITAHQKQMSSYQMLKRASDIEYLLENEELDDYDRVMFETELSDLHFAMEVKVDNIDDFMFEIEKQQARLQGHLDIVNQEANRLRRKRDAITKTADYFKKNILPRVIETFGDGTEYRTDKSTYRLATKFSKLIVDDTTIMNPAFLIPQPPKVDGVKARSAAIKAAKEGRTEDGFHVYEERYVKKI